MSKITLEQALAAKQLAKKELADLEPTPAIGVTRIRGQYAVKVNLLKPLGAGVRVPASVGGVPVRIEVVGEVQKASRRKSKPGEHQG